MHNDCGDTEKVLQLRQILCVSDLTVIPNITYNAAYRAQINANTRIDPYVLFAWQRLCEKQMERDAFIGSFSIEMLRANITTIKRVMFSDFSKIQEELRKIFHTCGIGFGVVHHFRGAPVQGFIKRTDKGRVILCLTIRGKAADRFWFSLFHEIGHILNGDLDTRFVDFDSIKTASENAADQFARDALIPPMEYRKLLDSGTYTSYASIERFSNSIGVPAWIVIGRLHSDEWLDWSVFAKSIPSYQLDEDA